MAADDIARVEREMQALQRDLQMHEDSYGRSFLDLVLVRGYLTRLLENGRVVRLLSNNLQDLLNAFQQIVYCTSLGGECLTYSSYGDCATRSIVRISASLPITKRETFSVEVFRSSRL